jgi:hypothetical protein
MYVSVNQKSKMIAPGRRQFKPNWGRRRSAAAGCSQTSFIFTPTGCAQAQGLDLSEIAAAARMLLADAPLP